MKLKKVKDKKKYKSLLEESVSQTIQAVFKKLKIPKVEYEVKYESQVFPYTLKRRYIPDFEIIFSNSDRMYIEAKGYLRKEDRAKLLAVIRDNPFIDLRLLFNRDHTLSKGSRNRYSDWAKKNNIPYAIGEVPEEWLDR